VNVFATSYQPSAIRPYPLQIRFTIHASRALRTPLTGFFSRLLDRTLHAARREAFETEASRGCSQVRPTQAYLQSVEEAERERLRWAAGIKGAVRLPCYSTVVLKGNEAGGSKSLSSEAAAMRGGEATFFLPADPEPAETGSFPVRGTLSLGGSRRAE